ncbi:DNA polymerase III PolC-type [compost metagenome]
MFRWIGKSQDGNTVTLQRLEGCPVQTPEYAMPEWLAINTDIIRMGAVLDVETTGLNQADDTIIEIAIRQFSFNKSTGEILSIGKSYSSFQDPGRKISEEISSLTGITDEMVAGKNIDWNQVNAILEECQIIIAHNAKFDRPFIDRKSKVSTEKIWGCSYKHIDWYAKGYTSSKLELLNIYHGFFTDSHRAINDVDALLYLLSLPESEANTPYLLELIHNAKRPMAHVIASSSPFESKDHLKSRGYRWDNTNRFWSKVIFQEELKTEITWLEDVVYSGPFAGITREIALTDSFKN